MEFLFFILNMDLMTCVIFKGWYGGKAREAGSSKWVMKRRTHVSICVTVQQQRRRRWETLTANLQFTFHYVFPAVVDGLAHVHAPVEGTGFTDLQRQDALFAQHPVLGFVWDVHLVFVPGHFGLRRSEERVGHCSIIITYHWFYLQDTVQFKTGCK